MIIKEGLGFFVVVVVSGRRRKQLEGEGEKKIGVTIIKINYICMK
jgi:hypothetical protein